MANFLCAHIVFSKTCHWSKHFQLELQEKRKLKRSFNKNYNLESESEQKSGEATLVTCQQHPGQPQHCCLLWMQTLAIYWDLKKKKQEVKSSWYVSAKKQLNEQKIKEVQLLHLGSSGSASLGRSPARSWQLCGRQQPGGWRRSSRCVRCPGGWSWQSKTSLCHGRSWWKPSGPDPLSWWSGSSSPPCTWNTPGCGPMERREPPTWCGPNHLPVQEKKKTRGNMKNKAALSTGFSLKRFPDHLSHILALSEYPWYVTLVILTAEGAPGKPGWQVLNSLTGLKSPSPK